MHSVGQTSGAEIGADGVLRSVMSERERDLPVFDRSESRIPTRLIDRSALLGRRGEVRIIGNGVPALFRAGPYDVLRGVVRAPGAWLVEARGPNGEAVLLQLAHLADDFDPREEARIAKATAALFVDNELPILAHGGADREDGTRILFWAMPWRSDVDRLSNPGMYVEDVGHLLRIAVALTTRLATRHILGGFEPLLSEHTVIVQTDGAEIIGVPVGIAPHHLAHEMPAPRLAPEELPEGPASKLGDLWRLGHALIALAPGFDRLPDSFRALLQRLGTADPDRRPARATEVLAELEAIHAQIAPHDPPLTSRTAASTVPQMTRLDFGHDVPMVVPPSGTPTIQAVTSQRGPDIDDEPTLDGGPPWAFFFSADEFDAFLSAVAKDLTRRELPYTFGTGVVQIGGSDGPAFRYMGLSDLARTCHRQPRAEWSQLIRHDFDRLLEATAKDPDVGTPVDFEVEPAPLAPRRDRRNESLDSVLVEPVPIIVGGRMSDIEEPTQPPADHGEWVMAESHPTHPPTTLDRPHQPPLFDDDAATEASLDGPSSAEAATRPGDFDDTSKTRPPTDRAAAFAPDAMPTDAYPTVQTKDERPSVVPRVGGDTGATVALPPVRSHAPSLIDGSGSPTLGPELRAIATNQGPKRAVLAVFLILTSVGGAVWAWQNLDTLRGVAQPKAAAKDHVATPANAVRIDAEPAGTVVVSEQDGRVLGTVPLRVLVPPGVEAAVLVTAPRREPQRLVLPDRGVISTRLSALPEDVRPCALDLDAGAKDRFEGVAANLDWGDRLAVFGAAVVRTRDGASAPGAWLVRCPSFGGGDHIELERSPLPGATITLKGPAGAEVFIDDEALGPVPATTRVTAAFARVRVELDGRRYRTWIPTLADATFELPEPHERIEVDAAEEPTEPDEPEQPEKRRRRRRGRRR